MIAAFLRRRARVAAASAAVVLLGLGTALAGASPAAAAGVGYVRLAHLSPDTPAVDVYLSAVNGSMATQKFDAVGYGVVSKYLPLAPGTYAVAMRLPGAAADSPPVLSTQATVVEGKAYTVAGVGKFTDLGLRVIPDDLALTDPSKAKVRVVQASVKQPVLDVSIAGGAKVAGNVEFATTTDYQLVEPGTWTLRLAAPSVTTAATTVTAPLKAGSVYSLIVLDGRTGLTAQLRTDATSNGVPAGGVDTGGGGMAGNVAGDRSGGWRVAALVAAPLALLAVLLGGGGALLRRRRGGRGAVTAQPS
ncbi:DUF4397 domain-containing protein [Dactylosporangium aurantiacum]|uniref:DUF4397 domain-containing protein n=1 Tax=Dactylosporangium aurantiacum TaxID=35754 RepID=A0A9Q9IEY1_9ACTN|nr:DUF4397 domain-containing protein [Dactylosporangium aurantiacum]MDG6102707.1 DUF4397 domain-containing protein [Dactylosporangium aurantiacum]UWZ53045.1 DUF4397 domain-containing protein [Dactylosporangium aurantiacum]